jgi:hypothetical protein
MFAASYLYLACLWLARDIEGPWNGPEKQVKIPKYTLYSRETYVLQKSTNLRAEIS